jgi:N-acetylneuraminic acid mutarotase
MNASGVYGTLGVAAAATVPGARNSAGTWVDQNGDFWLWGGYGYDSAGTLGDLNDLWRYDPAMNQWAWIGGSNTVDASGIYGSQGVPAADNVPGARSNAAAWVDGNGKFWLFGGYRSYSAGKGDQLNDLWQYDPTTNQWTWMGGANTPNAVGVYGTQGVTAADNVPGARAYSATWVDDNGNLWLFGGYGSDVNGSYGQLNDLWKYDPVTGQWTWISGSSEANAAGIYGTQGVAAATNVPRGRSNSSAWVDGSGNFWLFGGLSYSSNGAWYPLNDLWQYDPATNQWTWMSGSNKTNAGGVYGTQGVTAATNVPGARSNSAAWVDDSGDFWLFGGTGKRNDLWEYSSPDGGVGL